MVKSRVATCATWVTLMSNVKTFSVHLTIRADRKLRPAGQ